MMTAGTQGKGKVRDANFPELASAITVAGAGSADTDTYVAGDFTANSAYVGIYRAAIGTNVAIFSPTQSLTTQAAKTDQQAVQSGANTFWETDSANKGIFASARVQIASTDLSDYTTESTKSNSKGLSSGACPAAQLVVSNKGALKCNFAAA